MARQQGIHLHIAHISSALGLHAAEEAIAAGTRLTLETCPQYLWRTEADFARLGNAMRMNPPVRRASDQQALRDALRRDVIGIVATDHAPHTDAEKAQDLDLAPGYDADLVVVDPHQSTTFSARSMRSRQKHGALEGLKVSFAINSVYLRGTPVYANGRVTSRPSGRMVGPAGITIG